MALDIVVLEIEQVLAVLVAVVLEMVRFVLDDFVLLRYLILLQKYLFYYQIFPHLHHYAFYRFLSCYL
ncbi:hypothetical protein [Staphylococcus xylosus]|uniref:hypothetical protein n=1 Tax=Staphylococcus xylosus TaxID=1288 RepID=UPI001CDB5968|nr:hypothetical protein [Staphylococcus xylosus]